MNEKNNNTFVKLNFTTCLDYPMIFDYNAKVIKLDEASTKERSFFIRTKTNQINKMSQHSNINTEKGDEILFYIRKSKNNTFTIDNPIKRNNERTENNINILDDKLWYILKSEKNDKGCNNKDNYILNVNDIIKIGNSKYEVIEKNIHNSHENDNQTKYDLNKINKKSEPIFKITEIKNEVNQDGLCRICFDGSSTEDNPKIRLCKCKDFIHYECLKLWIKTKKNKKKNTAKTVLSYYIKKFHCDVCLTPYPLFFKINGINKQYSLVELNKPKDLNYIILESLENIKYKKIHIITLNEKEILIGSNDTCDVIDKNIFISRKHAVIKYYNGDAILENRSTHFNTLILVKGAIPINENKIDFQCGRTIISANLKINKKKCLQK